MVLLKASAVIYNTIILVPFCIVGGIKWRQKKDQETQLLHQINLQISLQIYRHVRNAIKVSLKTVLSAIGASNESTELVLILQKVNWLCCAQPQKLFSLHLSTLLTL